MSQGFTKGTPIDTDPTLSLNSDIVVPSQKAVKAYVASQVGTPVSSVTASLPILSSGGLTPNISIPAATTSVNGYLTSADWTIFNGKQNTIAFTNIGTALATTIANPSAISFIRIKADNTVDTRTPAQMLTDLGIASTIILARDNSAYSLTGVSVNTLVWSVAIPPNTLQTNDFIEWFSLFNTNAPNGQTIAYRIYVNTSASISGALLIGLYSNSVGTGNTNFQRNIYVTASGVSGNLRVLNTGSNSTSSYGIGAGNATNQTIDTTTTLYFIIAFGPNNTAITTSVQSTLIRITR